MKIQPGKKLLHFNTTYKSLCAQPYFYPILLLLFTSLTTVLYYLSYPTVDLNADTPTYLSAADRLFAHPYLLLDPTRLPGYPLFIALIYALAGQHNLVAVSDVQAVLFILTALEVYLLALLIFRRPALAFIVALLFGTNPTLLGYSKAIMSEGLAALLLTSLALAIVSFLDRVCLRTLCFITVLLLLLIFTRPEWLLLPLPLFAGLCLVVGRRKKGRYFLPYVLIMSFSLVLIYGCTWIYSEQNAIHNHYYGLTTVSSWNYMGKVLQYDMQDEVPPDQKAISQRLDVCIVRIDRDPFHVLPCVPPLANDQYDTAAGTFALGIILHHPGEFLFKSLPLFVSSLVDYHDVTYHVPQLAGPLAWLQFLHRQLYWLNIGFPVCALAWLILYWRRPACRVEVVQLAAIFLLVGYGVIVTTLAGYRADDYMRFHIVFDPLLILFTWGSILQGACKLAAWRGDT